MANSVAGYYRVSQASDDMKVPELYEDEITRYCRYRSLRLAEIFSDIDYSGYNHSEKRPALNELVRRRGEFGAVIIPKLSRFGRSLRHLTQLFETFDQDGVSLVFLDLGMDTSRGIPTAGGHPWQPNKVGRLLDNSAYAALMLCDGDFVAGNWEALVDGLSRAQAGRDHDRDPPAPRTGEIRRVQSIG